MLGLFVLLLGVRVAAARTLVVNGASLEIWNADAVWRTCTTGFCDVSDERITGSIPADIGACTGLEGLDLQHNALNGTIPTSMGLLVDLERLNLQSNMLGGTIPSELGSLTKLVYLSLEYNELNGTLPYELGFIGSQMRKLNLNNNLLTGTLPTELGHLNELDFLYLFDNEFEGAVPLEICDISGLACDATCVEGLTGDCCGAGTTCKPTSAPTKGGKKKRSKGVASDLPLLIGVVFIVFIGGMIFGAIFLALHNYRAGRDRSSRAMKWRLRHPSISRVRHSIRNSFSANAPTPTKKKPGTKNSTPTSNPMGPRDARDRL